MKKFKSVIAMILALSVILCFASCGKKSDAEMIKGKWIAALDLTTYTEAIFSGEEMDLRKELIPSDTDINAYLAFEFDGDMCKFYFDTEKTEESIDAYLAKHRELLKEDLYKQFNVEEIGLEKVNDQLKDMGGVTLDDLLDFNVAMVKSNIIGDIVSGDTLEGYYKVEEGKLYIAESKQSLGGPEYYTYSFDDGKFLIEGASGETFFSNFEQIGIKFPFAFEKN